MKNLYANSYPVSKTSEKTIGVIAKMDWIELGTQKADFNIIDSDGRLIISMKEDDYSSITNLKLVVRETSNRDTYLRDLLSLVDKKDIIQFREKLKDPQKAYTTGVSIVASIIKPEKAEEFFKKYGIPFDEHIERFELGENNEYHRLAMPRDNSYVGYDYYLFCIRVLVIYYCHTAVTQLICIAENIYVSQSDIAETLIDLIYIDYLKNSYSSYAIARNTINYNNELSRELIKCPEFYMPMWAPNLFELLKFNLFDNIISSTKTTFHLKPITASKINPIKEENPPDAVTKCDKLNYIIFSNKGNPTVFSRMEEYVLNELSSMMSSMHPKIIHKDNDRKDPYYQIQSTNDIFAFSAFQISLFLSYISNMTLINNVLDENYEKAKTEKEKRKIEVKKYNQKTTKLCKECGNPFIADDERFIYCRTDCTNRGKVASAKKIRYQKQLDNNKLH
ncbi:MAG: hypothetical protein WCG21_01685 [Eubacteriales bacterium]